LDAISEDFLGSPQTGLNWQQARREGKGGI